MLQHCAEWGWDQYRLKCAVCWGLLQIKACKRSCSHRAWGDVGTHCIKHQWGSFQNDEKHSQWAAFSDFTLPTTCTDAANSSWTSWPHPPSFPLPQCSLPQECQECHPHRSQTIVQFPGLQHKSETSVYCSAALVWWLIPSLGQCWLCEGNIFPRSSSDALLWLSFSNRKTVYQKQIRTLGLFCIFNFQWRP